MLTYHQIDVLPLPVDPLEVGPYTGRTVATEAGSVHFGKLLRCRLSSERKFYLVSVDGGRPKWLAEEAAAALCASTVN